MQVLFRHEEIERFLFYYQSKKLFRKHSQKLTFFFINSHNTIIINEQLVIIEAVLHEKKKKKHYFIFWRFKRNIRKFHAFPVLNYSLGIGNICAVNGKLKLFFMLI